MIKVLPRFRHIINSFLLLLPFLALLYFVLIECQPFLIFLSKLQSMALGLLRMSVSKERGRIALLILFLLLLLGNWELACKTSFCLLDELFEFLLSFMERFPLSEGGEAGPSKRSRFDLNLPPSETEPAPTRARELDLNRTPSETEPEPEAAPPQVPQPAGEQRITKEILIARIREWGNEILAALEEEDQALDATSKFLQYQEDRRRAGHR